MEEYNNNTNINNNINDNNYYNNKSSSLLNTESITNETLNTGERKGLIKSFISDAKKAILNPKNHLDYILTDRVLRLTNKDYKYYAETEEREKLNNSTKEIIKQTKDYLRLDSNPLIEEEKIETINNLEQIKNNPLAKYININIDDNHLENFKAGQYNSSQNIIKNGTTGIVNYLDQDNEERQILLTGNELITEDKDNIYISRNNLDNTKVKQEVIIPKHYKRDTKLKDIYTKKELEQLKKDNVKYRTMTDEEWLEEMNKTRTFNYALNKTVTNKVRTLAHNIPDSIKEEIDYLDPIGINEYSYLESIKTTQEPLIESALLKIKQGQNITAEEEEALWNRKYINYSIMRRGVAFRSKVFSGVIKGVEDNLMGTATMLITDALIDAGLAALAPATSGATGAIVATRVGAKILKLANKFNKARKASKILNYSTKALKWAGLSMAGAKVDTLVRTHLFENIPGIDTKQDRLREKKNNWMLKVTDKGNLFIRNLTQDQENFLNYQDNIEQFNEAWSERAIDPIIEGLTKALRIPKPLADSVFTKVLKKVNQAPAVVGTTFDGLLTEHLEEIFGLSMNHLMRANDPDTTYYQALKEYLDPNNFAVSTLNIYIAGGLIKTVSNAITENPNNNETQSIDRTVVKNYFKRKFENNPEAIALNNKYNSIDQYNYERVIDNLPETKIQTLANNILETEDNKSKERYKEGINQLKQNLINLNIPEVEANNLLKIYDTVYSQSALNYGVSRADVLDKMKLEFRLEENNNVNNINNKESIDTNIDIYNQAINKDLNLDEEINILDISNSIKGKITKETIKQKIQELIDKKEPIKTLSEPWMMELLNKKKKHIINGSQYGKLSPDRIKQRNRQILNIDNLIKNSVLIETIDNTKKDKKSDVDNYYYFYTPIKDNDNIYIIKLVAENSKERSIVNLYDIMTIRRLTTDTPRTKSQLNSKLLTSNTISIKQILQNVKDFNGQNALESYLKENTNNNPETYNQTAYHGSPYNFDRFTLDHIGEGEGAQAHGWGLYFALDKKVAENYKDNLTNNKEKDYKYKNKPLIEYRDKLERNGEFEKLEIIDELLLRENIKEIEDEYIEENTDQKTIDWWNNDIKKNLTSFVNSKLYEVDIPEDNEMLREETEIKDQPKEIQDKLKNIFENLNIEYSAEYTGYSIYENIKNKLSVKYSNLTNSQIAKKASELLNQYDIKGIRYNGSRDGECAVVFDDKAIKILETYSQTIHNTKKGRILFRETKAIIELFKNKADQSTLLHESAHYFLKLIQTFSNEGYVMAEQQLQDVMDWTTSKMTKNPTLFIHERFARGFEQYVRSGKANNNYLKEVFDYFKSFLERIYKNAEELDIDLNNRQMFEFFDKYLYHPESYNNWVYGDDDDDNKELNKNNSEENNIEGDNIEEYNINNIKYSNDLTTLILNQSTTTDETLRKAINDRIKEIVNDLERQATFTEAEVDNLVIQKLNLDYTNNELNLLLKAIDNLTEEQKLLKKEMENKIELYKDELSNASPLEFRIQEETERRYKELESKGDFRDKTIIAYNVEKEILKDIQTQAIDKIKEEYTEEQIALAGMKDIFDEIIGENNKQKQKNNIEEDYYLWNKDNWKDEVETEEIKETETKKEETIKGNKIDNKENNNNNNKVENKEQIKPTKTEVGTSTYRSLKEQEEIERQREREEKLNIIKRYNTLREQQEEERRESEYLNNDNINLNNSLNDYYNNPITESQRTYVNNIFNILDKLWDKDLKEKTLLEKKTLNRINRNRIELLEEAERLGYDAELIEQIKRDFKPYRNVKEMLTDYEIRTKNLTFKQQKRNDYKNGLEGIFGEHQLGLAENYYLTNDDYRDIVNFKQRTLKKNINNLLKTIEEQHKVLTTAEKTREKYKDYWQYANESIEELKKVINNNIKFNDDFKKITGITANNLKLIMENTNPSMDTNTLNKILNTAKKHNNNPDFILKEINRNKAIALKKDIQNTINNLLQHTVSFSKTTGKLYGNIIYRDTGLIRTLKQYNRMSMKQAGKELIRITEQKNKGENLTDTQTEYELKKNLLYFRSTPAINLSPENQLEILNSIGNFIKESRNKQKELKANNLMELIKNKNETIELIKNSKIGKGIFNLSADIIAHKGNLPTLLEYIGGKELANKFDFIPMETAYRVGTKEKTDRLFNRIFDSIINTEKGEDNKTDKTTNNINSKVNNEPTIYNQTVNDNQNIEQEVIDLTEEFSNIKSTDPDIVASTVEAYLNTLINKEIDTATNPLRIKIIEQHKGHIINSNVVLDNRQAIKHNTALKNLETIINNSILDNTKDGSVDLTHNSKRTINRKAKEVESYRYFKSPIKINDNVYNVELTTEVLKNSRDKNVSNLYNIRVKKNNPASPLSTNSRWESFAGLQPNTTTSNPQSQEIYNQSTQSDNTEAKDNQTQDTNTTQHISQLFEDYSKPITTLKVIERDNKGYSSYREVRLKERLDTLVDKLIVEMEARPQNEYTIASINYLKSLNKTARKGGGIRTYKYRLSEYDFGKLKNIIDNTKYKDNNILDDNIQKPYSEIIPYEIDRWGLMYYYLQSKNKATNKLINDYYGNKQIETLNNILKQQDSTFFNIAEAIFDSVQDRDELNVYYVMEFNKDMGEIDNYFPRVSFHQDDTNIFDMLSNNQDRYQKITAIENRSINAIPNLNNNPLLLALRHIRQTEFTKTIAVELNKFDKIFNSPSVKQNIIDIKGQDIHNAIGKYIEALKYNYREQDDNVEKLLGYMIGNWAKSVTNTPSVFLKQITSFFSYMEDLNPVDFMNNYVEGLSNPIETLNYMLNKSPYIKVRFDGNEYKDLLDIISNNKIKEESPLLSKLKNFNRKTSEVIESITPTDTLKNLIKHTLTELGDIASVIYGGYARLQTQLRNGLNERDAILDFERWTMETQQSDFSSLKSKSNLKEGLFNRLAGMFRSQDSQYLQKTIRNFIRYFNKEEDLKTIRNRMLLYHITLPLMMTLVQGLINAIYGKKDKEWWKYSAEFMTAIAYSFLPLTLLGQSVALDITFDFKNYMKSLMNLQGAITGLPLQAYRSIVKNWKRRLEEKQKGKKK